MRLFDTHCHLDDEQFELTRRQVISRALDAGVVGVLAVGTTASSSAKVVELSESFPSIWASVGIQPNYVAEASPQDWEEVLRLASHPRVVALGETGLDCYWDYAPLELQRDYFARHLQLSQQSGLPFIVHMRDSGDEILEMLRESARQGPLRGVMHSFTGDQTLMNACIELGLYISFAGMVTFKKSEALREVAAQVPADRLLIETDAPYLSPHPNRGKRPNEPAWVALTASCLAQVRGVTVEELAEQTLGNALRLFDRVSLP